MLNSLQEKHALSVFFISNQNRSIGFIKPDKQRTIQSTTLESIFIDQNN
jgi:hypothetical protein